MRSKYSQEHSNEYCGFVNVNKPPGLTSFDVIRKLRKILGVRKLGHSGVLDKPATGVLPIGVGRATKLFKYFTNLQKIYLTTFIFGFSTDTDDILGRVLQVGDAKDLEAEKVKAVLQRFVGDIVQIPPRYSTTKVAGKPYYKLAAKGEEPPMKFKPVKVDKIEFIEFKEGPTFSMLASQFHNLIQQKEKENSEIVPKEDRTLKLLTIRILCRGGFYVRSLARDLGEILGVKGCVFSLVREQVGPLRIESALTIEAVERKINEGRSDEVILPPSILAEPQSSLTLDKESISLLRLGRELWLNEASFIQKFKGIPETLFVLDRFGELVGVVKARRSIAEKVILQPKTVFPERNP